MITITAVIRAVEGSEDALEEALRDVAAYVRDHEPDTVGFFVSRSLGEPTIFTTYERFVDEAAKDRHNASPATARFFEAAKTLVAPPVDLFTSVEVASRDDA
ncbi:putative quinol monooxygenase [Microbaculum marinum]|uniref:Antibiotic biosynthesis monooxygenase n=1 Tax=Microbaculum marinum TaxID=1764581 RepID=A0AAW9RJ51_9HYPH